MKKPPAKKNFPSLVVLCLALHGPATAAAEPGVVVETLAPGSVLTEAGIRAGDVLSAWERLRSSPPNRDAARGELGSPFDWLELELEQAPRGTVVVEGNREGERLVFTIPPGVWKAKVRPLLTPESLRLYRRGQEEIESGLQQQGLARWRQAAGDTASWRSQCWLLSRIAAAQAAAGAPSAAEDTYRAALEQAREPLVRAVIWQAIGDSHFRRSLFDEAEADYRRALAIREQQRPESLSLAASHHQIGMVMWYQERLDLAAQHYERAYEIRRRLAPESLVTADSLRNLGNTIARRGDLVSAQGYFEAALAMQHKLAPDSVDYARTLNSQAVMALHRGDLEVASDHFQRAFEIQQRLDPESVVLAGLLNNLGAVARILGELELAEGFQVRALEIQEKLEPDSLHVALSLSNLADIAADRGELEQAASYHRRALEIRERLAPAGLEVSESRYQLAQLAIERGQLEAADRYLKGALELQEKWAPDGVRTAKSLASLGQLEHRRHQLGPALDYLHRALAIWEKLAPRSSFEAETLHALGTALRDDGQLELAGRHLLRALDALEGQIVKLGSSQDVRGSFRARQSELYRDAVSIQVDLGRTARAFEIMERSRGQSFLALMAERDLSFAAEIPADLEQQRRLLAVRYDRIQQRLVRLDPAADREHVEALVTEQHKLLKERDEIAAKVRRASPRLGAIQYPQPLDLTATRDALDPGTVLLAYSVGAERTELFVVTKESGLTDVETLEISAEELDRDVRQLRQLILEAIPGSGIGSARLAGFAELSRRLYRQLIEPVAATLEGGRRLLILPDGPLHLLPFAGLLGDAPMPGSAPGAERDERYLAEWKPLHFALSATVYAELRKTRQPDRQRPLRIAAFGDARYREADAAATEDPTHLLLRSAVYRDRQWSPLPHTRREVAGIAALFPQTATYLGDRATEEQAKSLGAETRIVHFAAHSHLDDRFPLNSALVLTLLPEGAPAGRDNGLLQAWEIFENVRLDADLVVLSACQSALGKERPGEGLLGLSRAFQFAGARTVAATLWSVADQTTSELMVRFYRHLRSGKPKDEALQAAQIELLRGPITITGTKGESAEMDTSAPFYWAAFQILGDWR